MPISTWATAALVFVAVALASVSVALLFEWLGERRKQQDVLGQLRKFERGLVSAGAEGTGILRRAVRESELMTALAARFPTIADLQMMLQQAAVSMTTSAFLTLTLGLSVGLGLVMLLLFRSWFAAILFAALGAWIPYLWLKRRRNRRMYAFEEALPEAIDLLGRAIRAGHPLSSGLKMVADETQEPIAGEFQRTFEEHRFGVPFDDAIQDLADRVNIVDVRILVTAILIQREVGGNLAEVLDNLASVIRARFTIRRQLRVYTAQGRMSGYVLAALPIIVGGIIYMLNPEYGALMFTHSLGRFFLGLAATMQIIGYLWIRKIINIDI
jgi:tight adherence protein B